MVINGIKKVAGVTITAGFWAAMVVAAPLVSIVAAPIFALKAVPNYFRHRALYQRTLTDLNKREPFGRIAGQDYTRWDGKAIDKSSMSPPEISSGKLHALIGEYIHGKPNYPNALESKAAENPFRQEDSAWLGLELKRIRIKKDLDKDLKLARAFAKAIIPLAGVLWVLKTETGFGGASMLACPVCLLEEDMEKTHWRLSSAISFQLGVLSQA